MAFHTIVPLMDFIQGLIFVAVAKFPPCRKDHLSDSLATQETHACTVHTYTDTGAINKLYETYFVFGI